MDHNICFNCGGTLRNMGGKIVCENCGSCRPQNISSEEVTLLITACQRLRLADFSEAEAEFEDIIRRHPRCAQAYWGHLLAKYGIKYEEDYDGRRIPTCYAASIECVLDSSDYKQALAYADGVNQAVYKEHATYIERCRKDWIQKANKEKPYDIFISYKDSDREYGIERTKDSYEVQDLYYYLKDKGYRVFFSRESLKGISGKEYEPYIFNALSTAKLMIVYASKPEYIQATWVKNEWTRYLKRIRAGEKKEGSLLVAYDGFAPMELPSVLARLQCLDAKDKFFLSNLTEAVENIFAEEASEVVPTPSLAPTTESAFPHCKHETVLTVPERAATCTRSGLSEGQYCELCGMTLKMPTLIPPTGHAFGEWRITKKATCTENGKYERVCTCGERETQTIPSRGGHVASEEWEIVTVPTPGKAGVQVKKCVICGEPSETAEIPALPKAGPSEGLAYRVNRDGKTCTVTGQGTCQDKNIVIPEEIDGYRVTDIAGDAYTSGFNRNILSVTIPNSVTSIDHDAFCYCTSLASVTIPNSVKSIGYSAFSGCTSLASVTIPNSVTSIDKYAFDGCTSLTSVTIPNSVKNIQGGAFAGVGEIKISHDHPAYTSIDGNLYSKDKKTLIHYAANHKETSFTIPNSVTSIGEKAFFDCTSLASVTIPSSVTSIGRCAFYHCTSLASVTIPDSVTKIEGNAFAGVGEIKISHDHPAYTSIDGNLYSKDRKELIHYAANPKRTSFVVPTFVTSIGKWAFSCCDSLKSVTIPNPVTSIGDCAFYDCTSLASVTIPNSVTSIGSYAFRGCKDLSIFRYIGTEAQWNKIQLRNDWNKNTAIREIQFGYVKPEGASQGWRYAENYGIYGKNTCTIMGQGSCKDQDVVIPEEIDGYPVTDIGGAVFRGNKSLTSVTISGVVERIGDAAFFQCTSLASVTIADSVKEIGDYTFQECAGLREIRYNGTKSQWKKISLGSDWRKKSAIRSVVCTDGVIKGLFLH